MDFNTLMVNILQGPFNVKGSCVPGRLYFVKPKDIFSYLNYGVYLREVYLPVDDPAFRMVKDGDKYGANMIILGAKRKLDEVGTFLYAQSKGANLRNYGLEIYSWAIKHALWNIIEFVLDHKIFKITYLDEIFRSNFLEKISLDLFKKIIKYFKNRPATHNIDDILNINNILNIACKESCLEIIKYLVELGADIHNKNNYPFVIACKYNQLEIFKYLKSIDDEHNSKNDNNMINYFNIAVSNGCLEIVKYLVSNSVSFDYSKTIELAIKNCNNNITDFLIEFAVPITREQSIDLFNLACTYKCYNVANHYYDESQLKNYCKDIVSYAVHFRNAYLVDKLIEFGRQVKSKKLIDAINDDDFEMVKFLVDVGLDVTNDNNKPIRQAFKCGNKQIIDYLHQNALKSNWINQI